MIVLNESDNTAVVLSDIHAGTTISALGCEVVAKQFIPFGHKISMKDIKRGEIVLKYGLPIGKALFDIHIGEHIHTHNLVSLYDVK